VPTRTPLLFYIHSFIVPIGPAVTPFRHPSIHCPPPFYSLSSDASTHSQRVDYFRSTPAPGQQLYISTLFTLTQLRLVAGRLYSTTRLSSLPISLLHRRAPVPTTAALRILTTTSIVASNNCNTLTGHRHDNSRSSNQLAPHITHHGGRHAGTSDAATPTR